MDLGRIAKEYCRYFGAYCLFCFFLLACQILSPHAVSLIPGDLSFGIIGLVIGIPIILISFLASRHRIVTASLYIIAFLIGITYYAVAQFNGWTYDSRQWANYGAHGLPSAPDPGSYLHYFFDNGWGVILLLFLFLVAAVTMYFTPEKPIQG